MYMALGKLIKFLEGYPPETKVPMGFGEPHSFRGYYEDVAFEPVADTTVGEMLAHAKSALGKTFQGYKGGDFQMNEYTYCWIANYGETSDDKIGYILLNYMVGGYDDPPTNEEHG